MPIDLFANAAATTLTANVTTTPAAGTAELWSVAATGSYPQIGTAQVFQFRATVNLANDPNPEIVIAQQINSATTMTVLRGSEGSPVKTHNSGVTVSLSITSGIISSLFPSGKLEMYAGATAPVGWLLCDGSAVNRTTYANLFAAIGTTWGAGDGSTTFNLPDLRGRSPIGAGLGPGLTTTQILGQKVGNETHTLTSGEIPAHNHPDSGHNHGATGTESALHHHAPDSDGSQMAVKLTSSTIGLATGGTGATFTVNSTGTNNVDHTHGTGTASAVSANTGGGGSHPITHPCAVINYIIKV